MSAHPKSPPPPELTLEVAHALLAEAAQRPWLATLLMRRTEWLTELAQRIQRLSRQARRTIHRALASGMAVTVLLASFIWTSPALAGTITVDGTTCSLADAITTANSGTDTGGCTGGSAGADTLDLTANLTLTNVLPDITSEITIEGNGHTIQRDSSALPFRVLSVSSSGNLTLKQATISDGELVGQGGAGIYNDGGTVTLQESTISGNSAPHGGGLENNAGLLTVQNSTIANNTAYLEGAGIFNTNGGTLVVQDSTISNNIASVESSGGGIANEGTSTIQNSLISGNSAMQGGGIFNNEYASMNVGSSTISANSSGEGRGGGIHNAYGASIDVFNSTISGNSAGRGGGVYNSYNGTVTLRDSTITANSATSEGGGVYNSSYETYIQNSIVAAQTSGGDCYSYYGFYSVNSQGYNIESAETCDFTATGDQQNVDATALNLGALANNGGPTQTHALGTGSVAIDQIAPGTNGCVSGTSVDQRGAVRADGANRGGSACDVGAYEANSDQKPTALTLSQLDASSAPAPSALAAVGASLTALAAGFLTFMRRYKRS